MGFFLKTKKKSICAMKREMDDGVYTKCDACQAVVSVRELSKNLDVCPTCQFHHRLSAKARIEQLVDSGTFKSLNDRLKSKNPLDFPGYDEKLEQLYKATQLNEAIVTGIGRIDQQVVAIGVLDSYFLMGSMGSVVGEKVTRLFEVATAKKLPVILFCASGGARMQEGIFSLMQMAKTSAAIKRHCDAKLLFISVLTHPTMGGVTASFATLGDILIAESGASIGFAGRRVIEQTIKQALPDEFQTAEFLQEKGLVDQVVTRDELKPLLATLLHIHKRGE